MNKIFQDVSSARVERSVFNLSYEKKMTMDMGQMIPVICDEAVPGDIWEIGNSCLVRFQPLLAPIMHSVKVRFYSFFVPYRILDDNWEEFITRGEDGNTALILPKFDPNDPTTPADVVAKYSLWDYLGFPIDIVPPSEASPIAYPKLAYYRIWNEYFRDQNLQTEIDGTDPDVFGILNRNWTKDYFTSALLTQQRGAAPALPVVGSGNVIFDLPYSDFTVAGTANIGTPRFGIGSVYADTIDIERQSDSSYNGNDDWVQAYNDMFTNNNELDVASLTSVDISDLRLAFQLQVWMERNNRAGVRYTEFLQSHFRVSPRDDRLQRPEYIGGTSNDVIISEVLQTSESTGSSKQGNMAGHGISVQSTGIGKYRVQEFGLVMTLMCVTPVPAYQNGINKQWLRRTTFDFYFPEFAHLSEQAILNEEICVRSSAADPDGSLNNGVFGYTGVYNEMRYKPSMVCADMRDDFKFWHLGRIFDHSSPPALNSDFVECVPRKDIFAVPTEPGLFVNVGNHLNVLGTRS